MKARKTFLILSLILCIGLLVACNAEVAEKGNGDELVYATFEDSARELIVSYNGYVPFDELYWFYDATKTDAYGTKGEGTYIPVSKSGEEHVKGLSGKVGPFSQGLWSFTLYGYDSNVVDSNGVPTGKKVYQGTTDSAVLLKYDQTNYIPVTVAPSADFGYITFGNTEKDAYYEWEAGIGDIDATVTLTITIPVTIETETVNLVISEDLETEEVEVGEVTKYRAKFNGDVWYKQEGTGLVGKISVDDLSEYGYSRDIPADVYAVSFVIEDEDGIILFAKQDLGLKVFGGLTATITGDLKELLSEENYFSVPEVDVQVWNPTTAAKQIESQYVAADDGANKTTTVSFPENSFTSSDQHSLAIEVYSSSIAEVKFEATDESTPVAGLDLTLTKVTKTSAGEVTEETVDSFNGNYVTIVTYINPGLEDVVVKYNGTDGKEQPHANSTTERGDEGCNVAAELTTDEGLGYNKATGYLSFETNHFSEYYVQAKVYVQNVNTGKYYHSFGDAVDDAQEGQTIKLLTDIDLRSEFASSTSRFAISKSLTIDGNGNTCIVAGRGFGVGMNASGYIDVVFKNISITNSSNAARCIDTRGHLNSLTLENVILSTQGTSGGYSQPLTIGGNQSIPATITIKNSTIQTNEDATEYYAIVTFNPINMTIEGSTIKGWACLYLKGPDSSAGSRGSIIEIKGSHLYSYNRYSDDSNNFGVIKFEDTDTDAPARVVIEDTDINISVSGSADQAIACYSSTGTGILELGTGVVVNTESVADGSAVIELNGSSEEVIITGGTYDIDPTEYVVSGYVAVSIADNVWQVVPAVAKVGTTYFGSLKKAVESASENDTVELLCDTEESASISFSKSLVIDGKGFTLHSAGIEAFQVAGNGKTVEIKNINIDSCTKGINCGINNGTIKIKGVSIDASSRGLYFSDVKDLVIVIEDTSSSGVYGFNVDSDKSGCSWIATNSTFNGWNSSGNVFTEPMQFNECSFGKAWGYSVCKTYGSSTFNDCKFSNDYRNGAQNDGFATGTSYSITLSFSGCMVADSEGNYESITPTLFSSMLNYDITSGSSSGPSTIDNQYWYLDGVLVKQPTTQQEI